jgi:hypothetical protein
VLPALGLAAGTALVLLHRRPADPDSTERSEDAKDALAEAA